MKTGRHKTWKAGVWLGVLMVAAVVAAAVFFRAKPMIEPVNNPRIASISATVGRDGETYDADIPESEISDELNDALISRFLHAEMRNGIFPYPQTYPVSDGSVSLSIKVSLDDADRLSMRVNLSSLPDYNSAQFGDSHYRIVGHQSLYQDVYALLSDVIPAYVVKR